VAEETGKDFGGFEYGRAPYGGCYIGNMEYGRIPAIGYRYRPYLTIQSSPDLAAPITVTPNDVNGDGDGNTNFDRLYDKGTAVTVTAPATHSGKNFSKWTLDGVDQVGNPIIVTMDTDYTVVAIYVAPPVAIPFVGAEMLKVLIPRYKYWKSAPAGETSYPNLQDGAEGKPIPEAYGVLKNITPVCVDTVAGTYKIARRTIKAIDEVRNNGTALVFGTDYRADPADLALGEFTLLTTPLLTGGATYYFIIESDAPINGADYLKYARDNSGHYGQSWYEIDAGGNWAEQDGGARNFEFKVFGRTSLSGADQLLIDAYYWAGGWNAGILLGDVAAHTRVAQKFIMPAGGPYYISKIQVYGYIEGVASTAKIQIVSAYSPEELPVGAKSQGVINHYYDIIYRWAMREGGTNEICADIQGYPNVDTSLMENVADVLYDIYVNILGGSATGINVADLLALWNGRSQDVALYMSEEKEFQESLAIFEAGHLFKLLPSLDGDFAVRCLTSGEPAGTPHLKAEHIANFSMRRSWANVFQVAKVKYYQDPTTGDWLVAEEKSTIAQYLYNRQDSIEIETALKDAADATQLAKDYLGTDGASTRKVNLQYPTRLAAFDVPAGYGDQLIPTMKVKLTLPRADYAGGVLNGILFRVLEVNKNPMNGESHIQATLDSLTY